MGLTHTLQRFVYRGYRNAKRYCLEHPCNPLARVFFALLQCADRKMSPRRLREAERLAAEIWKAVYFMRFNGKPPYRLQTSVPVALASDDHRRPRGSLHDNSTNHRFNLRVYDYFKRKPDLALLDLGCAGGGLVKSFIADGYTAVGLEGSDVSLRLRSAEWDTIPYHLFTCDISEPFQIIDAEGAPVRFDIITAWDVLEHIPASKTPNVVRNIAGHLASGGLFIASVDEYPDGNPLCGAVYHLTCKPKEWWLEHFESAGLRPKLNPPFEIEDFVRGNGQGCRDWDPRDGGAFHLVLEFAKHG